MLVAAVISSLFDVVGPDNGVELAYAEFLASGGFCEIGRDAEVFQEEMEIVGCLLEVVFLHVVSDILDDDEFELSLHLCDRQILVHSFFFREHQQLRHVHAQEISRETFEPAHPVTL